jgi:hypothetical protein
MNVPDLKISPKGKAMPFVTAEIADLLKILESIG